MKKQKSCKPESKTMACSLLEVMEEKNTLVAEKHARMISDLSMIRQAEIELS